MPIETEKFASVSGGKSVYKHTHHNEDGRRVWLYGHKQEIEGPISPELVSEPDATTLRWHPLRQEWNIYAPGRQNRTHKPSSANDPLAAAKTGHPPTEIPFADFEVVVFENRFPSLRMSAPSRCDLSHATATRSANGRCEVVVYGTDEKGSLASLSQARRRLLVEVWIDRYKAAFDDGLEYVLPFENRGDEVGVTLAHPHGQIYAFDFVPPVQAKFVDSFANGFDLESEFTAWVEDFGVAEQGGVIAFCPPFARFPFEVWIASRRRCAGPWEYSDEEREAYASLLGEVTKRYDAYFGRATPNMMSLHAAPRSGAGGFHFTTQFYPLLRSAEKIKYLASVEQSTGVFTIDVMPEWAARELRA